MIQITVRLFAGHRDVAGLSALTLTLPPDTSVHTAWQHVLSTYPALQSSSQQSLRFAVNQQFCDPSTPLQHGDELACIPPVSGGTTETTSQEHAQPAITPFLITEQPLHLPPLIQWVQAASDGAIVVFCGVVRNNLAGRATAFLLYEAYAEMAAAVLAQIATEAQKQWSIGRVAIHHRTGKLTIGETAVLVVVAAPHREAAFAAAAFIMERIKEDAPIWKAEHWADGTAEWH
jgi:molybdopterin synthase catalytic subunit